MTALDEYQRLESTGVWRAAPAAQRRDVIVALGEATLVLTDARGHALAHWSLAALDRCNPGESPALYAPGADATEDLELTDAEMIAAIERVRRAVAKARPAPGRLRNRLGLAGLVAVVMAGLVWMPDAVIRQAAAVAPPAARDEIGAALLGHVQRIAGAPCRSPEGDRARARLERRLFGEGPGRIVVLREGLQDAAHLPGGVVLVSHALVEDHETPEVVAGHVLAERVTAATTDPLLRLLDRSGMGAAFALLTTGEVPEARLRAHAEDVLAAGRAEVPADRLLAAFAAAAIRAAPYAYALDISGEATVALIEADPVPAGAARPILSDGDWVALQGICGS